MSENRPHKYTRVPSESMVGEAIQDPHALANGWTTSSLPGISTWDVVCTHVSKVLLGTSNSNVLAIALETSPDTQSFLHCGSKYPR